jgi:thymidine kinase
MSGITFTYGPMFAGKTHELTKLHSQYTINGYRAIVLRATPRAREGRAPVDCELKSRTGMCVVGQELYQDDVLLNVIERMSSSSVDTFDTHKLIVVIDEAQFLTPTQVKQLVDINVKMSVRVFCYGLRADIFNRPFDGSAHLMACATQLNRLHAVCSCGELATCTANKNAKQHNADVYVDTCSCHYSPVCYKCWTMMMS